MRVLLLGGTGNLGSCLLTTLNGRGHTVVTLVRNPSKLTSHPQRHSIQVEEGDAKKAADIRDIARRHQCDAIVNAAGHAAMAPWGKSDLPAIVDAVIQAALELGQERHTPMRVWFLGGQGILDIPTLPNKMIADYIPMFLEHATTWKKLQELPPSAIAWSILCPGLMRPAVGESLVYKLSGESTSPPGWSTKFLRIPVLGPYMNIMSQISSYATSFEMNADFIATDLEKGRDSEWLLHKVGVKQIRK
ncbi:hypothetical protein BO78DRAFT_400590 [Aspergillus sclerotiicarbonarius CBS 121057]|uniref:NAD(P)-binding domain-containing protein n=1 Tax=Aspergillus sclerotiicarbonarius (strain CBS 121057 / IBT 28362) TaxID=1448318 RepID=A0A319EEZ2_ASPSB|nr:hypothetical protein BO78DRAFT_400590 [Aspergillus sclerotiicarbonarius CBS 121057]